MLKPRVLLDSSTTVGNTMTLLGLRTFIELTPNTFHNPGRCAGE